MNLSKTTVVELQALAQKLNPMDHASLLDVMREIYMGPKEKPMWLTNMKENQRRMLPLLMKLGVITRMASEETYEKDRNALNYANVFMNFPETDITYDLCGENRHLTRYTRSIVENSPQYDDITVENMLYIMPHDTKLGMAIRLDQVFTKERAHLDASVIVTETCGNADTDDLIYKERFDLKDCHPDDLLPLAFRANDVEPQHMDHTEQCQVSLMSANLKLGHSNAMPAKEAWPLTRLDVTMTGHDAITVQLYHGDQYDKKLSIICNIVREKTNGRDDVRVSVPTTLERRSWTL